MSIPEDNRKPIPWWQHVVFRLALVVWWTGWLAPEMVVAVEDENIARAIQLAVWQVIVITGWAVSYVMQRISDGSR